MIFTAAKEHDQNMLKQDQSLFKLGSSVCTMTLKRILILILILSVMIECTRFPKTWIHIFKEADSTAKILNENT